jgi:hypothetical protein
MEVDAAAATEWQGAARETLRSGFNEWAEFPALEEHSKQVYQNPRLDGLRARHYYRLHDDAGQGPVQFDVTSMSFTIGKGGLIFNGIADPATGQTQYTLPLNGEVFFYIEAQDVGSDYNAAPNTIDTFSRGAIPGASANNPLNSLSAPSSQHGADAESVDQLRMRNRTKWATLGVGSPPPAYENWVRTAHPAIKRVEVFTNLDISDPGRVDVLIAGDGGALSSTIVQAAQNALTPAGKFVGGNRIPACAKAVVSSAINNNIALSGKIYVEASLNQPSFRTKALADLLAFQRAFRIGQRVSWERLLQVVTLQGGTSPSAVPDVEDFLPNVDTVLLYNEVPLFDGSALQFLSR